MKKCFKVVLFLMVFVLQGSFASANEAGKQINEQLVDRSAAYVETIYRGDFSSFYKDLSDDIKKQATEEVMYSGLQGFGDFSGTFMGAMAFEYTTFDEYEAVAILAKHMYMNATYIFTNDKKGTVVGFSYSNSSEREEGTVIDAKDYGKEPLVKRSIKYVEDLNRKKADKMYADINASDEIKEAGTESLYAHVDRAGAFESVFAVNKVEEEDFTKIAMYVQYKEGKKFYFFIYSKANELMSFKYGDVNE